MAQSMKWTKDQTKAITTVDRSVFVSASAGTGKTAVLAGRFVDIVTRCHDVSSNEILVMTFTEAAAEQMRLRISDMLNAVCLTNNDLRLRRQLMLVETADICTMHSFCKKIISENFNVLKLDPSFRIINSDEQKLLKSEALEKTIDCAWRQENLVSGLGELFNRRNVLSDDGFLYALQQASDSISNQPSRARWFNKIDELSKIAQDIDSPLGASQTNLIKVKLSESISMLDLACRFYKKNTDGDWHSKIAAKFITPIVALSDILQNGSWPDFTTGLLNYKLPNMPPLLKVEEDIKEFLKSLVTDAKSNLKDIRKLAIVSPDYLNIVNSANRQEYVFLELVKIFDDCYSEAKKSINSLDFNDLESLAFKLLASDADTDEFVPSCIAEEYRKKYKHVFVDEYQDINQLEQAIIKLVSTDSNSFFVGDIKQSIYSFRGSDPTLFVADLAKSTCDDNASLPLLVNLSDNWRSDERILDFVNLLFNRIMTSSLADIDYDESAMLRGNLTDTTNDDSKPLVEICILDSSASSSSSSFSHSPNHITVTNRQCQAAFIVNRIKQLVSGDNPALIYDKNLDRHRKVEYSDIVILMRSPAARVIDYVELLRRASVPVNCQSSQNYLDKTEISDCLSLLKILDNFSRDIDFASLLRCAIFNIDDSQLAKIRLHNTSAKTSFHESVTEYIKTGSDKKLADRLAVILSDISNWRQFLAQGKISDLLWQVIHDSHYMAFVASLPQGKIRKSNLLSLYEKAVEFEGFASCGLHVSLSRFVNFIEKLQQTQGDLDVTDPLPAGENAVSIMSIHKSKGLEFPIVFLAEADGKFGGKDAKSSCLVDTDFGIGLYAVDDKTGSKTASMARQVISQKRQRTALAEEMRLLYVAATRAKNKLIIVAKSKASHCHNLITRAALVENDKLPSWLLSQCKSYLDWILASLSSDIKVNAEFDTGLSCLNDSDLFSMKFYHSADFDEISIFAESLSGSNFLASKLSTSAKPSDQADLFYKKLKDSLSWRYSFASSVSLPAKMTVTRLSHGADEFLADCADNNPSCQPPVFCDTNTDNHLALSEKVNPAALGIATHMILSKIDLSAKITHDFIEQTIADCLNKSLVDRVVASAIDIDSILSFFDSELGSFATSPKNTVRREWPFTMALDAEFCHSFISGDIACDKPSYNSDDFVVIQGVVDLLIETPSGIFVIDFKTDKVAASDVDERAENYRRQLALYSLAVGRSFGAGDVREYLYFLHPSTAISLT